MFLMVSYMFQKYATLAFDIYDDCLCHIWRWLMPYLLFKRALRNVQLSLT